MLSGGSRCLGAAMRQLADAPLLWARYCAANTSARRRTRSVRTAAAVSPDTSIDDALAVVAADAGLPLERVAELTQHLQANWYATAGDVARMSREELQQTRLPVKLWSLLRARLAAEPPQLAPRKQPAAVEPSLEPMSALSSLPPPAPPAGGGASQRSEASAAACAGAQAQLLAQQQLLQGADVPWEVLPADIMQRRMPRNLVGHGVAAGRPRVRVRKTLLPAADAYSLQAADMPPELRQQLQHFQDFSCGRWYGQRVEPLRAVSFEAYAVELRRMLGYLHTVRGAPLAQLGLRSLLPSAGREGVSVLMEYQHWRQQQRGVAPRSSVMPVKATICLARWLYHDQSEPSSKPPYRDLPVMQELSALLKAANKAAAAAPMVADEGRKFMASWAEYLDFVRALRAECAGLTASGRPRVRSQVAASLQRYLVAAILSVVPDRQRTLRELEVGRTLVRREADGAWVIKHGAADYKTGKQYGDRPPLVLAPFIYPELEAFIGTWRAELAPATPRLFVKPGTGGAHTSDSLRHMFTSAALRLTGKATNPHLVRDMIVTHLRQQGACEQDLESLAMMMAHSLAVQRSTYDRRTREMKVRPAVELMMELSGGLAAPAQQQQQQE